MSDYFEIEERLQEALSYKRAHPKASLQFLSRQFKVDKNRIHRWLKDQNSCSTCSSTNQKLDKDQDLALCWYIKSLYCISVSLHYKAIAQAANQILTATHDGDNPPTVGEHWPSRWLKAHLQYTVIKEKPIESQWQQVMNIEDIHGFFEQFKHAKTEHQIKDIVKMGKIPEQFLLCWRFRTCQNGPIRWAVNSGKIHQSGFEI